MATLLAPRSTRSRKSLKEPAEDGDDGWESDQARSDSDEDVLAPDVGTARKRKATTPKGRAGAGGDGAGAPAAAAPARKRTKQGPADLHSLQLFDIVLQHSGAISRAAKEWVQRYRTDRDAATAELLTLLAKSTGSLDEITADDVAGGEVDEVVQSLAMRITEESGIDPFTHRATARTFPEHYRAFWDAAIREAAAQEVLFDGRLPDRITNTVTALSCFVAVGQDLAEARETAQYQLEQEEKKKGKAATDRAATLRRQVSMLHHRAKELEQVIGVLFQGVFAHRFRDVDERVRAEVISAIGAWAAACPATFLSDSYLKYLAWAQSDAHPAVRAAAVAAIEALYQDSDNLPRLTEFTGRFRARFVELMSDVDGSVAAAGLRLLSVLVKAKQLPLSDVHGAYQLLADGEEAVRRGAAGLVAQLLEEQGAEAQAAAERDAAGQGAAADRGRGRAGKKGAPKASPAKGGAAAAAAAADEPGAKRDSAQLEGVLLLMGRLAVGEGVEPAAAERRASLSGAGPIRPLRARQVSDLVAALADELPLLCDAQLLISALGNEAASASRGRLGNAHLAALIAALMERAASQHAATGRARGVRAAAAAASERAALHQSGSVALMPALPKLMGAFQSEPEVAAPLVRCVRAMRLELFALRQQEAAFAALLDQVAGLFARHADEALLAEAAATLVYCARAGPSALLDAALRVLRTTAGSVASKLAAAAAAVARLGHYDLAAAVAGLEEDVWGAGGAAAAAGGAGAPAALHSLLSALQRARALLAAGARELAAEAQVGKAVQALLDGHTRGRDLGTLLPSALVCLGQLLMVWSHAALAEEAADALEDATETGLNDTGSAGRGRRGAAAAAAPRGPAAAAVSDLASRRSAFVRALEAVLEAPLPPPAGDGGDEGAGAAAAARRAAEDLRDRAFCGAVDLLLLSNGTGLAGVEGAPLVAGRALVARLWGHLEQLLREEVEEEDDEDGLDVLEDEAPAEARKAARREAAARLIVRRAQIAALLGRLLVAGVLPREQDGWLGARLVGLLGDGEHPQVQEVARGVCRELRRARPAFLPHLYLAALKTAWEQVEEAADPEDAMAPFEGLASAVSGMYNGFNLSVPAILAIVEGGLAHGCESLPARGPFLGRGLSALTPKLPQPDAQRLAGRLEAALSKAGRHDEAADGWRDAHAHLEGLKARASGAKVARGGLKAPGARSKPRNVGFADGGDAGGSGRARSKRGGRKARRRAAGSDDEDGSDEVEEDAGGGEASEEGEEEEERDAPTPQRQQQQQQQQQRRDRATRGRGGELAAVTPPSARRAALRSVDVDLGPLPSTQSQGADGDASQPARGSGRARRQQQQQRQEEEEEEEEGLQDDGGGSDEDMPDAGAGSEQEEEEEEEEQQQPRGGGGAGRVVMENSQGSLMVQVDDDTEDDAINVDEPPPAARRRRGKRF
ncbi:hypothetical protein Rsub_11946 [Raphidocelis subcapitata]|uniref:SCD domain-containing protein n=1 Tax=Raphidocelis subcapitata TaxID=307507 RepID=A0A2V0PNF6_9CHLO|nr:hypothetical protein Rsub_11946 [Raphidocelis subcapitata]|eukprot:GBF99460.1 hypothetical protein Rsub_11946 [Raphidocelis subcapitata]